MPLCWQIASISARAEPFWAILMTMNSGAAGMLTITPTNSAMPG